MTVNAKFLLLDLKENNYYDRVVLNAMMYRFIKQIVFSELFSVEFNERGEL